MIPLLLAAYALLTPPTGWTPSLPSEASEYIQIGFVGPGLTSRPTLNLAIEEVEVDLPTYLKAAKKIHTEELHATWRDLGKFTVEAGAGRLTEITLDQVKILQFILISDQKAYIVSAACPKKEYPKNQPTLLEAIRSLHFLDTLFDPPLQALHEAGDLEALKKAILSRQEDPHWQFLALKELQKIGEVR
jgi:hypothetical protein